MYFNAFAASVSGAALFFALSPWGDSQLSPFTRDFVDAAALGFAATFALLSQSNPK